MTNGLCGYQVAKIQRKSEKVFAFIDILLIFAARMTDFKLIHISETDSAVRYCEELAAGGSTADAVVWADYQTAGRGCGSNQWESERGKNLLFSVLLHPEGMLASRQFHISMAVSVAICEALEQYIGDLSIKWPNDIYWRNGKLGGILIVHSLQGTVIRDSIVGVGINVNQRQFVSDAPNPVSMWQITGQETDLRLLLDDILCRFRQLMTEDVRSRYMARLYRRKGYHPYADAGGAFMARLADIREDGRLVLSDEEGCERVYAFKEVQFII